MLALRHLRGANNGWAYKVISGSWKVAGLGNWAAPNRGAEQALVGGARWDPGPHSRCRLQPFGDAADDLEAAHKTPTVALARSLGGRNPQKKSECTLEVGVRVLGIVVWARLIRLRAFELALNL